MEHIRIPQPERPKPNEDDPYALVIAQQERKRDAAMRIIAEQQTIADSAQNVIDRVQADPATPTVILEIGFVDVEYDIYSWSETTKESRQYSVKTESLDEAITLAAQFINPDGQEHKMSLEPHLHRLGVVIGPGAYVEISDESTRPPHDRVFQGNLYPGRNAS